MQQILNDFKNRILLSNNAISQVHRTSRRGYYVRSKIEREFLTEYAFLKVFVAWEYFLEKSYLAYSTGMASCRGRLPTRRIAPASELHAYELAKGRGNFIEWGNGDVTRFVSKLVFDNGEPFETPLASITQALNESKTVRNSIAHISTSTQMKLDNLFLTKTGVPRSRITPYDFIMMIHSGRTIYQEYVDSLDIAADLIANY